MKPSHFQALWDLKITRKQVAESFAFNVRTTTFIIALRAVMHSGSSSHQTLQFIGLLTETKTAGEGTHADVSSTNPVCLCNEIPSL